jgi:hypothetical protein
MAVVQIFVHQFRRRHLESLREATKKGIGIGGHLPRTDARRAVCCDRR